VPHDARPSTASRTATWTRALADRAGRLGARLGVTPAPTRAPRGDVDPTTADLVAFVDAVDDALDRARPPGCVAVVAIRVDAPDGVDRRWLAGLPGTVAVARLDARTWLVATPGAWADGLTLAVLTRIRGATPAGSPRLGVAVGPTDAPTASRLVHLAELAALSAVDGVRWHSGSAREGLAARRALAEGLRASLHTGEVEPWFQPIQDARTQAVVGAEALVRWRHPTLGVVGPDAFLPAVRGSGSALDLGRAVVRRAVGFAARWRALGRELVVSVNVFPEQLRERWTLDALDEARTMAAVPPHALRLEVSLRDVDDGVRRGIERLVADGFGFALDGHGLRPEAFRRAATLGFGAVKLDLDGFRSSGVHVDWGAVRGAVDAAVAAGLEVELVRLTCATELARARRLPGVARLQGHAIDAATEPATFAARHLREPALDALPVS
jgi:EAL domain-containing protein (putative c-di-GMP-specific phosphodiesterase class I)